MTDFLKGTKPYYELDITLDGALNTKLDLAKMIAAIKDPPPCVWMIQHDKLPEIFDLHWMEYMRSIGLNIGSCMIFYRTAHYTHPSVHVDVHKPTSKPSHYGINWVLDPDDDSEMIWYTWPNGLSGQVDDTPADTPYLGWCLEDFTGKEICRHTIGKKMTLVNTSMPHNVETKCRSRWAFSLRFQREANCGAANSWLQAVKFFQPFFKERV